MRYLIVLTFMLSATMLLGQDVSLTAQSMYNQLSMIRGDRDFAKKGGYNDELQALYLDTDKGPYLENRIYGVSVTFKNEVLRFPDSIEFRFDILNHELQFFDQDDVPRVVASTSVPEFYLRDWNGTSRRFVKIYPPLVDLTNKDVKYYEVLSTGDYELYKLNYARLNESQFIGPGSDGSVNYSFVKNDLLIVKTKEETYESVKPKGKQLVKVLPELTKELKAYEKENGKIVDESGLIKFFNSLSNS